MYGTLFRSANNIELLKYVMQGICRAARYLCGRVFTCMRTGLFTLILIVFMSCGGVLTCAGIFWDTWTDFVVFFMIISWI